MAARVFVEELRLRKFGIGSREDSPVAHKFHETIRNLSEGFHEAIRNLSENLYQKDIHFLLEILQNVEDNSYPKWVSPSLEIILTDKDVTETGASGTLLFFNNEVGFSEKNIEALCSIGRSTKKGNKAEGYIGEKGIGFKSVFLVSGRPHIISNGFRIRFHDEPDNEAGLGYVVPEWTEKPTDEDLALLYGSRKVPCTVVVLPLRDGKLENVAKQLAQISPESLLFLSKLSRLCIRDDLQAKSTALSRTVEAADTHTGNPKSFTAVLSVESCGRARETSYYMSIQKFSVPDSSKIASRFGVDEWTITLAFPFEDGVLPSQIGRTYGNVFSFLPTEVQSQFPFLINADFILTSSREAIVYENVWNQGILNLIPGAFCDAFENLLKIDAFGGQSTNGTAPLYRYIPASRACPSPSLEKVRLEILKNLKWKEIVLCDSEFLDEKNIHFCRASDARTVIRTFRGILNEAIGNFNIQSPLVGGRLKFVNQSVQEHQTSALSALNVQPMVVTEYIDLMPPWWIQSLPDKLYAKLLSFIAFDLDICNKNDMACKSFKFLEYKDHSTREIKYASILDRKSAANEPICLSSGDQKSSWLSIWADVLSGWITFHVMTERVLFVLNDQSSSRLLDWLTRNLNVISITPESFAEKLISVAVQNRSPKLALICMHFFFDMEQKGLPLNTSLKGKIPLLDCLGSLQSPTSYKKIFLPPSLSQWPLLMKPETWADVVTKLSDQYLEEVDLSSVDKKKSFRSFLERKLDAIDVLQLHPLNQSFPTGGLARKEGAMLFLEWIKNVLKNQGYLPREFFKSVASNSCWVRTDHGPRSPTQSFLLVEEIQKFFIGGDLPFIDTEYYGRLSHRHEWEAIGVHTDPSREECYMAAVEHFQLLMTSPASEMSADKATRFYTYFSSFKQRQNLKNLLPTIWIPRNGASSSPSWGAAEKCLISDEDALFETKYSILGTFYNSKRITSFFHNMLGVPLKPGFEHFSELWLDWTKEARNVKDWECLKTWTVLAAEKNVKFREGPIWSKFLNEAAVPSTLMGKKETITLLHPLKTLVPDALEMEHLFQASSCPPPMAWYPRSQVCKLSTLFSIYNSMGAQNLSECVKTETDMSSISTSKDIFSDSLCPIQPLVSPELFKLVMGLVSKELSEHERKKVLLPLLTAKEMVMNEGLKLTHSLCLGEQTFTTSSEVLVFWLRSSNINIIYHVERCQLKDAVSRLRFNQQLCKAISHGLLSERREMAEDLQQRLSIATLCDLDSSAVDFMLRNMNIPVSEDDMSFIQSKTLEDAPSIKLEEDSASSIPLETLRKRCNGSDEDEVAVSKTVEKLRIGSSSTSLEPLVTQLNISDRPVTPALITSMMGGIGLVKQQKGNDGIPSRTGSNSGNGTNMLEKEKFQLELLHEVRSALLGEGKRILIEIDVSVEPALGWYKAQLLSVRHFLGYPPEPGSLKRGMRVMDLQGDPFDLDKCLFLAFAHPMVSSNGQFGTMHERFTTLGHACLNMWITCELLNKHPEKNMRAIVEKRDKMMSRALFSEFLRASHLNMCIVGADSCDAPKILSDVFMAIMGVGYLCYECGLDEVRRLYLEVFVESLEAACEATH